MASLLILFILLIIVVCIPSLILYLLFLDFHRKVKDKLKMRYPRHFKRIFPYGEEDMVIKGPLMRIGPYNMAEFPEDKDLRKKAYIFNVMYAILVIYPLLSMIALMYFFMIISYLK